MVKVNKKGISDLIATVLMIVIVLVSVVVISSIIIPFVKKSLNQSNSDCMTLLNKITIISEESYYDDDEENTYVRIRFGNVKVDGIYIALDETSYEIKDNVFIPEINSGAELKLPQSGGGEVTYIFNSVSETASVGGIINKQRCDILDSLELK